LWQLRLDVGALREALDKGAGEAACCFLCLIFLRLWGFGALGHKGSVRQWQMHS
jgi:hypothetical protein